MLNGSQVSHVLLDLDGLLIDSERIYTERITEFVARYGKVFSYRVKRLMMGRKPLEFAEVLRKEYDLPMAADEVLKEYRKHIPVEVFHEAALMPGARRLIQYLHRNSIPMAVATGSSHFQIPHKMWNDKDVWQLIHHIVASGDDPEVILHLFTS